MIGKCHICKQEKNISYCKLCEHWFCDECSPKIFSRGIEAIKQLIGGKQPNCCGPKIKMKYIISHEQVQEVIDYLSTQKFADVYKIIEMITKLEKFIEENNNKPSV